jgi:hypothetical protein
MKTLGKVVQQIVNALFRLWRWWMADITKRQGIGKIASISIGLFVICCVCSIPIGLTSPRRQPIVRPSVVAQETAIQEATAQESTPLAIAAAATTTADPTATISPTSTPAPPTNTPKPTATSSPATNLEQAVRGKLAQSNRDLERIQSVELAEDGVITIWWTINDNLTEGMIKTSAKIDAKDLLQAIDESGVNYTSIILQGSFPLVDAFGATEERYVVKATYSKVTVDKIVWSNFNHRNVYVIADEVTIHPAFQD